MSQQIRERRGGGRISIPEGSGERIRLRIMGWEPGAEFSEGSSGLYPVAAIKRDFAEAFPVGTRMRANHDGFCEAGGDVRRIMAKTVSLPEFEEDGAYAWARVKEGEPSDFIRQFADVIGVSVSVAVELAQEEREDEDDEPVYKRSEDGRLVVERFLSMEDSPYNAIDFVEAPGADGRIVALATESARQIVEHMTLREAATFARDVAGARETSEAAPPRNSKKKESSMEPEEIRAAIAEAAVAGATAALEASRQSDPPSEQPTLSAMAEAVVTAGLSDEGRAAVYERVDRGETLDVAIAAEAAREASIEAEVQRRVDEALASQRESSDFSFGYTSDDKTGAPLGTEDGRASRESIDAEFDALTQEA